MDTIVLTIALSLAGSNAATLYKWLDVPVRAISQTEFHKVSADGLIHCSRHDHMVGETDFYCDAKLGAEVPAALVSQGGSPY